MSEQLISTIDGKSLYAKSAASAGTASVAVSDVNGAPITGTYATQTDLNSYQPTANMTAYQPTITYGYSGDAITAIDGSAIGGQGGQNYEGVAPIVVNNDEGKISADTVQMQYQQISHDDSLVHQSNNSVYALGVNMPMMPGYETVLYSSDGSTTATLNQKFVLSEPYTNFSKLEIQYGRNEASVTPFSNVVTTDVNSFYGCGIFVQGTSMIWDYAAFTGDRTSLTVTSMSRAQIVNTTAKATTSSPGVLYKVIGINRTAGGN